MYEWHRFPDEFPPAGHCIVLLENRYTHWKHFEAVAVDYEPFSNAGELHVHFSEDSEEKLNNYKILAWVEIPNWEKAIGSF